MKRPSHLRHGSKVNQRPSPPSEDPTPSPFYSSLERELQSALEAIQPPGVWVAWSGGRDSSCLVHAMSRLWARSSFGDRPLNLIHVHHGLHAKADQFADWVRERAKAYDLPLYMSHVALPVRCRDGVEAEARKLRYKAFQARLPEGHLLLLAHHRRDLVETLLLSLKRGTGLSGFSGPPALRPMGRGRLLRPWLFCSPDAIAAYAAHWKLSYCEDPTNRMLIYDRNFLRHEVLPPLQARWPQWERKVAQAVQHCRADKVALDALVQHRLQGSDGSPGLQDPQFGGLNIAGLAGLSPEVRDVLLRGWLARFGIDPPSHKQLRVLWTECAQARESAHPTVRWGRWQIRRFKGQLYALNMKPQESREALLLPKAPEQLLPLPLGLGTLSWTQNPEPCPGELRVVLSNLLHQREINRRQIQIQDFSSFRAARPLPSAKKFFQAHGFPPWTRNAFPTLSSEPSAPLDLGHFSSSPPPAWLCWRWWLPPDPEPDR